MDKVITLYNRGKIEECVALLEKLVEKDTGLEENIIRKNSLNICQSLLAITLDDTEKLDEFQDVFYLFYQNITSLGSPSKCVSLQLELVAYYNFLWWILFFSNDDSFDEAEIEQCIRIINSGMLRILGNEHIPRAHSNTFLEIINNIKELLNQPHENFQKTGNLILEIILLILLYILKRKNQIEVIEHFGEVVFLTLLKIQALHNSNENLDSYRNLFKFGLAKCNCNAGEPEDITEHFLIIKAACLTSLNRHKESLTLLRKNSGIKNTNLWCYLAALNSFFLENYDQSVGFLLNETRINIEKLKSRYLILQARLHSKNGDHKEALNGFRKAKELSPNMLVVYYYLGEEYGKMGLNHLVVESFESMVKIIEEKLKKRTENFTDIILNLVHPEDEISEAEALYALACSYGLDESFQQSTNTFEKLIRINSFEFKNDPNRILQTPDTLVILHEAAVMNLLIGDLIRSEQLCENAFEKYFPKSKKPKKTEIHIKDVKWLQNLINEELGFSEILNEPETGDLTIFYEENVHFFHEDIIGLLILAEIQKIQENDDYKTTLTRIYSIMSVHLSKMQKRNDLTKEESHSLILIKALTAKICLKVAMFQMKTKTESEVDRTFKRALSCNQGDKDVLYHYSKFFVDTKKPNEAHKLWKSFFKKESAIAPEQCQSLALRYLLSTNVSKRELEKMECDIELATLGADLNF